MSFGFSGLFLKLQHHTMKKQLKLERGNAKFNATSDFGIRKIEDFTSVNIETLLKRMDDNQRNWNG